MLNPKVALDILAAQLQPVRQWLDDPSVTELMINPGGLVFVEADGVIVPQGALLTEGSINMALTAIAKLVGKDSIANSATAIVNASIEDMRIAGAKAPVCPDGSFMTIRKHKDKSRRPTLDELIHKYRALTREQADLLIRLVIQEHKNCIIAGGTGSGKTTLLNALLSQIGAHERILTIEDSREIHIAVPNVISVLSNPDDGIAARDLVKLAMRMRPDRLILGETRGDETYDLIRAFNSGHPGSVSTIHADSAVQALSALEMLFQMSLPPNASMPPELVKRYLAESVHVIVFAARRIVPVDGVQHVVRRIEQISLITGVHNENYLLETLG
ncbi:CpaF family protein [Massilia sp. erpn]|uniref:CpaF family protein n=1 Tax=Massilia sp. erpn TaxID=2738142 RepID=UPI0021056D83|nr:ATPase, T2SS/T4P/T4SS family [Massilia sp. erpn]UTY55874.1 CpaF family protein [Massilia sp. erpn]